ncbi:MAG: DUF433 domain-containing protein [Gemmatimonadota bacterium]
MTAHIPPGVGLYRQADAARLLGIRPDRLRRWVQGYTYRPRPGASARVYQDPVVNSDVPRVGGEVALSFLELMELRVVIGLLDYPQISLQKIRRAADEASDLLDTRHPFASRRIFTDGQEILAALDPGSASQSDLLELTHPSRSQIVAGMLMQPILDEIDYSEETAMAEMWWPHSRSVPIVLNPRVMFGAPTIVGTRITTSVLGRLAEFDTADEISTVYDLPAETVRLAAEFEATLRAA